MKEREGVTRVAHLYTEPAPPRTIRRSTVEVSMSCKLKVELVSERFEANHSLRRSLVATAGHREGNGRVVIPTTDGSDPSPHLSKRHSQPRETAIEQTDEPIDAVRHKKIPHGAWCGTRPNGSKYPK